MTYISYNSITRKPLIQGIDTKTLGWVRKLPWELIRKIADFVDLKNQAEIMASCMTGGGLSWPARLVRMERLLMRSWENPGPYDHCSAKLRARMARIEN